jgi:septal ring factor EnvC (AmiA/AmiB activator)
VQLQVPCLLLSFLLFSTSLSVSAQSSALPTEIDQLKSVVGAQQKALEQQQSEIQKLQSQLAEQQQLLIGVVQNGSGAG